jgi:3-dehydroquinate synthase
VKAHVVSKDFKEGRLREILNYGHTLGHAIEKREEFKLRHGEAIAVGLVFAAELSGICLGLSQNEIQRHRDLLVKFKLPINYRREAFEDLIDIMAGDKKARGSRIRFIGIRKPGKVTWLEDVTLDQIRTAYERIAI